LLIEIGEPFMSRINEEEVEVQKRVAAELPELVKAIYQLLEELRNLRKSIEELRETLQAVETAKILFKPKKKFVDPVGGRWK